VPGEGDVHRPPHRILVVGFPRSGTTWLAQSLASRIGDRYVHEPDNQFREPFALRAKYQLGAAGCFPSLAEHDDSPRTAEYARLWAAAFGVGKVHRGAGPSWLNPGHLRRRAAQLLLRSCAARVVHRSLVQPTPLSARLELVRRLATPLRSSPEAATVIVKSVYALLAAAWISRRFGARVCVVLRDPRSVIASWKRLGWMGGPGDDAFDQITPDVRSELSKRRGVSLPRRDAPVIELTAWMWGMLNSEVLDAASQRSDWSVVRYESLVADPQAAISELASRLSLPAEGGSAAGCFIPGTSSSFTEHLTPDEVETVMETIRPFDLDRLGFTPLGDGELR